MEMTTDQVRLMNIFFPLAFDQANAAKTRGTRFVHYTRADAAINILRTKEVWMRKTSCMIDFMEVEHGLECLAKAYHGDAGTNFRAALDAIYDDLSKHIAELFDGWQPHFRRDTYITCFSEHLDEEDDFGRLSMWRTYSTTTGIALVMNNAPFFSSSNALKVYSSPVAYLSDKDFEREFAKVAANIRANGKFVEELGREGITNYVFNMFKFAALCTKHPGFREEKEWRIIHTPTMENSPHLKKEIQVLGGTPQPIYKIPLRNIPDENFYGVEIPEILNRIIIGPTDYPLAMREAFEILLSEAGVDDPSSRIYVSDIPLRI